MKTLLLVLAIVLPTCASAGKLDLTQDLGGLDLVVTVVPGNGNPDAIHIANKTAKVVTCKGSFTGADAGRTATIAIKPGKSGTMRVPGNYGDTPRSAELKCAEKTAAKK